MTPIAEVRMEWSPTQGRAVRNRPVAAKARKREREPENEADRVDIRGSEDTHVMVTVLVPPYPVCFANLIKHTRPVGEAGVQPKGQQHCHPEASLSNYAVMSKGDGFLLLLLIIRMATTLAAFSLQPLPNCPC